MNRMKIVLLAAMLAIVVFGGNYLAVVYAQGCANKPGECQCVVKLFRTGPSASKDPSCSVRVSFTPVATAERLQDCAVVEPGAFNRIVMCDTGIKASFKCQTGSFTVNPGTASELNCQRNGKYQPDVKSSHFDGWVNNVGKKNTNAQARTGLARWVGRLFDDEAPPAEPAVSIFLNRTHVLKVTDGDAGLSLEGRTPTLTVAAGRAEMLSLCSGRSATLDGPGVAVEDNSWTFVALLIAGFQEQELPNMEEPKCRVTDLTGIWRGGWRTLNAKREFEMFPLEIAIRGKEGTVSIGGRTLQIRKLEVSGEVLSPASSNPSIDLEASSEDGSATVSISGNFDKGDMEVVVSPGKGLEQVAYGVGTVSRLYIAQFALPQAAAGAEYRQQLYSPARPGNSLTWTVAEGELPPGMTLDSNTGLISGVPERAGSFAFTVKVTDWNEDSFTQPLELRVKRFLLTPDILPSAIAGQPYAARIQVAGGKSPHTFKPYFDFEVPGFPQVSATGEISLDPSSLVPGGVALFTVTDSDGLSELMGVSIPARGITLRGSQNLPTVEVGKTLDYKFDVAGATGDVTWKIDTDVSGAGLSFDESTGKLTGTPGVALSMTFDITAQDSKTSTTRVFDLNVENAAILQARLTDRRVAGKGGPPRR